MSEKYELTEQENPVGRYLAKKNKTLMNDYRTPDGKYAEHCGLIAVDIAKMLLQEGKRPSLVSIRGKRVANPDIVANEPLIPVQYGGRVQWGGHIVCVCEGVVYDPMIGEPLPLATYAQEAFGADVDMETDVDEDRIADLVK